MPSRKLAATSSVKPAISGALRRVLDATYDTLDRRQATADPLIPPRAINPNIGFTRRRAEYGHEFVASGERIADMLVTFADLRPDQSVLDIGCGIGRVARALTSRLSPEGRYFGFDVDPQAVTWCQHAYRSFGNFSFTHASVGYANVKGRAALRGEEFVFPYPNVAFDLVFSVSVYTHLSRAIIDRYLSETSRVLRPGGLCVNTFFVVDRFAAEAMRAGRADRSYFEQSDGSYLSDPHNPNLGIGFADDVIDSLHAKNSLSVVPPLRLGSWSGRDVQRFVYQDVVVAQRLT